MVNVCAACTKSIRSSQQIKCSSCTNVFHTVCVNISDPRKLSEDDKSNWLCPQCHCKLPKRDNSNTPVRIHSDPSATPRNASPLSKQSTSSDSDALLQLTTEIRCLRVEVGEIKLNVEKLSTLLTHCNNRLDEYDCKLKKAVERIAILEERESKVPILQNRIIELEDKLNSQSHSQLRNEVEIAGVNESLNESPLHIVKVTAQKIGITIDDSDIDFASRAGPRRKDSTTTTRDSNLPRTLVVRFVRRHKRDEFLKAAKSRRNLTSNDIEVAGTSRNIYVNERLTQENRQLFRKTRQQCRESCYRYCWIKNGNIFIRKQEGNPAIPIRTSDDLHRHFHSTP